MKRSLVILLTAVSISAMTAGTAFPAFAEATEAEAEETTDGAENAADSELEDGVYGVEFDTDSSMFHVNEACNGRATLTVKDGKMTVLLLSFPRILRMFSLEQQRMHRKTVPN